MKTLPGKATANLMPLRVSSYTVKNGAFSGGALLVKKNNVYVPSNAKVEEVPVGSYKFKYTAVGANGSNATCLTFAIEVHGNCIFTFTLHDVCIILIE